jgi:alkanesulfonate monooxygenase SsuD/methylene tetrahydromethanopterin reductase-like flavin-dependent oxidoreductase (luciferase family)
MPPPVNEIEWTADEREMVAAKFGAAIIGGPERVAARLNAFREETQADELIVVANTYDFADRLRSYELLAGITKQPEETMQSAAALKV